MPYVGACSPAAGMQSILNPQGPGAALIAELAWVLFIGGALIFVAVMALAAYAILGRRESTAGLSTNLLIVGGGIAFPAVTLLVLLV
jgi:cytochrome c oxidase subunit II